MKTKILSISILIAMSLSGMAQFEERKTMFQRNNKGIVEFAMYSSEDKSVYLQNY